MKDKLRVKIEIDGIDLYVFNLSPKVPGPHLSDEETRNQNTVEKLRRQLSELERMEWAIRGK